MNDSLKRTTRRSSLSNRRNGLSLIEVVLSISLVALLMLVSIQASTNTLRQRQQISEIQLASFLFQAYFDEISSLDFQDRVSPVYGLEAGENASVRQSYDDLDDYHELVNNPPRGRDDLEFAPGGDVSYTGWEVQLSVLPADLGGLTLALDQAGEAPLRQIEIRCTSPTGQTFVDRSFVSNVPNSVDESGNLEQTRHVSLGYSDGRQLKVVAPLRNLPLQGGG